MRKAMRSMMSEGGMVSFFRGAAVLLLLLGSFFVTTSVEAQFFDSCAPEFVSVAPPMGAWGVPSSHGIDMVFGPRSDSCFTMCWDTTTFHGWLMVCPLGAACDTVELGPSDVEFFWGDLPEIGIEYHYPGGWPDGAEVHGGWAIADCDSHYADGNIYFHVAPDTTTPPDCDIVFYGALPTPGTMMVPLDAPITMTFGPADSSCDSFCIDTASFEGAIHIGGIGMPPDTIFVGSGDVDFDYSGWPLVSVTYDAPTDWPNGSAVNAYFALSDCGTHRAHGETWFHTVPDTITPPDCDIVFYGALPTPGSMMVPLDAPITMTFGPADSSCDSFCIDTATFEGAIHIGGIGMPPDTIFIGSGDVDFDYSGWPLVSVTYDAPTDWPNGSAVNAYFALSDCGTHRTHGETWFHTVPDTITPPPDCAPEFVSVAPPMGAFDVPSSHGINMVFGPRSDSCFTMCWDTTTFHGWLMVCPLGAACDTVELGPSDVEFFWGDLPEIGIEYHYPGGWPDGAEVHGGWAIADCDSHYADGSIYFHVAPDTTTPSDTLDSEAPCFYDWFPVDGAVLHVSPGEIGVTVCDICGDTAAGAASSGVNPDSVAMAVFVGDDTLLITPPELVLTPAAYCAGYHANWHPPTPLPAGDVTVCVGAVDFAGNAAYDCVTWTILPDTTVPPDCDIVFYGALPTPGTMMVPLDAPITMTFGPADSSCDSFCVDTSSFEGVINIGGIGMPPDTIFVGSGDVDFDYSGWPLVSVTYDAPTDWPYGSAVDAYFALSDCGTHRAHGETWFHTVPDTTTPPDCDIVFYGALPTPGTMMVPLDAPITMTFGPADSSCDSFCVDTSSFEGVINIGGIGMPPDTIFIGSGDVDFDYSDWPLVSVTYDAPTDWPNGSAVDAYFALSDCGTHRTHGETWFHTVPDTTTPPDCDIVFYGALPTPGTMMVPLDAPITMTFGPADSSCDSFCVDTASFEGVINIGGIGMPPDTIFVGSGDVDFDYSGWPLVSVIYDAPMGWPYGSAVDAYFALSDCGTHRAHGETWFHTVPDTITPPPDCAPEFVSASPAMGSHDVSVEEPIEMIFGPEDPACSTFCLDTATFEGWITVSVGAATDTILLGSGDVIFDIYPYPNIAIIYDAPTDWPFDAEIHATYYIRNCDGTYGVDGHTAFHTVPDTITPPDCTPEFVSVAPPMGAWGVPSSHGIDMVFGPRSDSCFTMCWDTTTFHGWLMVCPLGAACDTVELGPGDVEFFWGDLPNIGIEYHYPGGWPDGAEVHGGWAIADCDSHYADGNIYFHVAPDTTTPPDCDIVFYGALPMPGTMMVPLDAPITMTFGPADSSCDSFCVDTSSFEGVINIGGIGMPPDTIFVGSGDVDFDYSGWPLVSVTYDAPMGWPYGSAVDAYFALSDCGTHRAHGETWFHTVPDTTTPPDCAPEFVSVAPPMGAFDVPSSHGINMVFGPRSDSCFTMCWDTTTFRGWLMVCPLGAACDTVELGPSDVEFFWGDLPEIGIEYHYPGGWPDGAEVHGGWAIADCDSHYADGSIYFHVAPDTTTPPDCDIVFYGALPMPGSMMVPLDAPITMTFGPADSSCDSFCVDTASFEGVINIGGIGMPPDTIFVGSGDVDFDYSAWPLVSVTYDAPTDWPYGSAVDAYFALSDCGTHRTHGETWFHTVPDTVDTLDCSITFYYAWPGDGDIIWPDDSIAMGFRPADSSCWSPCFDRSSFEGYLEILVPGSPPDTVFLGPGDVSIHEFLNRIYVKYGYPGGFPAGAEVYSEWSMADCDSNIATGSHHFYITTDCNITFYSAEPPSGSVDMPIDTPIEMTFGPVDPACTTFCIDTSSFEGWITIPGDTIELGPGDVDFDFTDWPLVHIGYEHPGGWPYDGYVYAGFEIRDCDSVGTYGYTYFHLEPDTLLPPPPDPCEPILVEVIPPMGTMHADPMGTISMTWVSRNPDSCAFICFGDSLERWGRITYGPPFDSIILDYTNTTFEFTDTSIHMSYTPSSPIISAGPIDVTMNFPDCYGDTVTGRTSFFSTPPDTFVVAYLAPEDSAWVGCDDQQIVFTVEPFVPESLIVYVNFGVYVVGVSPELSVSGDTVTFTPMTPWSEGMVGVEVLGERLLFNVDLSVPVMFPVYPADGATVPLSPGGVEVTYHIHDVRSGIDESSISITVMVDGTLEGTFGVSHVGVDYVAPNLTIDLTDAGVSLVAGDSVTLLISASDMVPSEYCGPNTRVEDLHFTLCDPYADMHLLLGHIVDFGSGDPIEGAIVRLFGYLSGPIPGMIDTTDVSGEYSFEVYPGTYTIGAFEPGFSHRPVFYLDRHGFLEADPIHVLETDEDTIALDTLHMRAFGPSLFSISGTIVEESDGPIESAYVVAISSEDDEIQDAVLTDSSGYYELAVPAGDYYVLAFHTDYCPAFYGGSIDYDGATEVIVTGSDVSGIDVELIPLYGGGDRFLWGYIFGDSTDRYISVPGGIRGVRIYVLSVEDDRPVAMAVSDNEGYYHIDDLLPGTYRVRADKNGYAPTPLYSPITLDGAEYHLDLDLVPTTAVFENPTVARSFELRSVYPNPFNSSCTIGYSIKGDADVRIDVVDVSGRIVSTIEDRRLAAGDYITVWSPDDLPSGVYMVRITANGIAKGAKALYVK